MILPYHKVAHFCTRTGIKTVVVPLLVLIFAHVNLAIFLFQAMRTWHSPNWQLGFSWTSAILSLKNLDTGGMAFTTTTYVPLDFSFSNVKSDNPLPFQDRGGHLRRHGCHHRGLSRMEVLDHDVTHNPGAFDEEVMSVSSKALLSAS
jgi:hypothetical protein